MAARDGTAAAPESPAAQTQGRRLAFAVLVLGLLCAICAPFFTDLVDHDAPRVQRSVADYANYGPLDRPVELAGDWGVIWRSAPLKGATADIAVPGDWEGAQSTYGKLPEQGAASYYVTLRGLKPGRYTLFLPSLFGGAEVAVDGKVLSQRGAAGATPETTRYLVRSQAVEFEASGADVVVRIDMSAFFHRDNGLQVTPLLGLSTPMDHWITLDWIRSLLLMTSLLLLACYGAVVFLFRPKDRASLYFALACLFLLPLIGIFGHDNLLMIAFPGLSFQAMLWVQYLTSLVALGLVLAYTHDLFPRESPRRLHLALQALIAVLFATYVVTGAIGDTLLMSKFSQVAIVLRLATILYILGVVAAACWRRRDGAVVFMVGMGVFAVTLVYSDLVTNALIPRFIGYDVLPVGMLLLLFSHIVILAERWSLAIAASEQTNEDLRRLLDVNISITSEMQLEALLHKIVGVTSKVIQADRSSLFLHDPQRDELWSVVAEGVQSQELRFPADQGLAGWVFRHGQAVNLSDAYADNRFNRDVDAETGYRTESVLAVPVTTRDGRTVGVMQALNRRSGAGFTDADLERMSAFAAQAAIAIDNATLFTEVAAERNYNANILASMSSGVVTFAADGRVAQLNEAAVRILETEGAAFTGEQARTWMEETNPELLAEVEGVRVNGHPKTLLEAEIRTARGGTISANISIVPLVDEGGDGGLLVHIEDITQGKRMQGAMRRFMTQRVVDQVMGQDELLFGVGCQASVLFADIRNFTTLAETLQPRETVDMLNEVFAELFEAVAAHDGVLDKFLGDAVMAVYGAPITSGRDAENAVKSAVAMVEMVEPLNARRRARGEADLRLGVGLATGEVVAGTIGSPKRMDYTVIGDSVNLAARLQSVTKLYQVGVVICETTAAAVSAATPLRELDLVRLRGRQAPEKIFQVLTGDPAEFTPALEPYRRGRDLMARRRWKDALAAFEAAVAADPADGPSTLMLERARILVRKPPSADWDGVWEHREAA